MGKLLVKKKVVVTPGEEIAEGMDYVPGEGTYRKKNKIHAATVGLVNIKNRIIKIISLGGVYMPKKGDYVVGEIIAMSYSSWYIDIGGPYDGAMPIREASNQYIDTDKHDMTHYYDYGDVIFAKIIEVTDSKMVTLTMKDRSAKKLSGGHLVRVVPSKVPRVIGRKGSMIKLIKNKTNTQIIVGQNGKIWINGEPENILLASRVIKYIGEHSHQSGLTEKVEKILKKGVKK